MVHTQERKFMEKIKRVDGKFFKIIPENGTVIGKAKKRSINKESSAVFTDDEWEVLPYYIVLDNIDGNEYIYSKAICSEGDVFDKQRGIDIAAAKLDMKDHLHMARKYSRALRYMQSAMRKLEDLINKHLKKAYAIHKDINNYYCGGERS